MAGASLLTLLDDIGTLLDDVATMTKVAAQKTTGVLGDDLALNAEQVSGVRAERELPVVWAVAKGSAKNKLILAPTALVLSATLPGLITPLLMLGGAYLCYEGFEKIYHKHGHSKDNTEEKEKLLQALHTPSIDMVEFEKSKIKGATRTDFILSAEIVIIALGSVSHLPVLTQILVIALISIIMTVGVYGFVAAIVKLDDAGLYLLQRAPTVTWGNGYRFAGQALLSVAPRLMKWLTVVGTIAMFLVGGGIIAHGCHAIIQWTHAITHSAAHIQPLASTLQLILTSTIHVGIGLIVGLSTWLGVQAFLHLFRRLKP